MLHSAADPGVKRWFKRWDDTMMMVVYINERSKQRANCVDDILDAEREVALGLAEEVCADGRRLLHCSIDCPGDASLLLPATLSTHQTVRWPRLLPVTPCCKATSWVCERLGLAAGCILQSATWDELDRACSIRWEWLCHARRSCGAPERGDAQHRRLESRLEG